MNYEPSPLLLAFLMLVFLSVMVDKLVLFFQFCLKKIPKLPDVIEPYIAYALVGIFSYVACWRFNFSIFAAFGYTTINPWESWLGTAGVLSGGSKFMREASENMDYLPGFLTNAYGAAKRIIIGNNASGDTTITPITAAAPAEEKTSEIKLEGRDSL
jgi:hypothetical protein